MKSVAPPNRVAAIRKEKKLSQQQLAEAVGAHWITISRLERGIIRLSDEWRIKIANALGVDQWDLVVGVKAFPPLHMQGQIKKGGEIEPLEPGQVISVDIKTEYFTHPDYMWLEVSDDNALWPWFKKDDMVCFLPVTEREHAKYSGRVCLAQWVDGGGDTCVSIGVLEVGARPGLVTIQPFGSAPFRDVAPNLLAIFSASLAAIEIVI